MNPEHLQRQLSDLSAHLLLVHTRLIILEGHIRAMLLNQMPPGTPPGVVLLDSEEWLKAYQTAGNELSAIRQAMKAPPPTPPESAA